MKWLTKTVQWVILSIEIVTSDILMLHLRQGVSLETNCVVYRWHGHQKLCIVSYYKDAAK